MTIKTATFDYTGKFEPLKSDAVIVLSYELEQDSRETQQYLKFIEEVGGFDPWNVKLSPMKWSDDHIVEHYLDSMTGALERGLLSMTEWPSQLFVSIEELDSFLAELEEHDARICDRHHRMLQFLTKGASPVVNCEQAAEALRDAAESLSHA